MQDLSAQRRRLGPRLEAAILGVIERGAYILGPEVAELEGQLAARAGVTHAVTCANGTDALQLALMALGVGPGDGVLVPTFTFAATAEAVALVGAEPIFVDVRADSFNIDPHDLSAAAQEYQGDARLAAVIAVDLFGVPADYPAIRRFTSDAGLHLIADAAQSFGATLDGLDVGGLADITTTSFFPAKPLGCYGDGGATFTESDELAAILRSLRVHGMGVDKYDNVRVGMNSRLDTLQAAVLLEKLRLLDEEMRARQQAADGYSRTLPESVIVPAPPAHVRAAWAQYTVQVDDRATVATRLRNDGVQTAVYYPVPLHRAMAYAKYPGSKRGFPAAEALAERVLSLPVHAYLTQEQRAEVVRSLAAAVA
jgi:dTDP-4-amino-4,6-dideoxygalactose transaminase